MQISNDFIDEIETGKCTCDYCETDQATHRMHYQVEEHDSIEKWGVQWGFTGSKRLCKRCLMLCKFSLSLKGWVRECQVTKIL